MTLNELLQAVSAKLKELWPERRVYVEEIPQDADGAFFVGVTDVEQEQKLDRRHIRTVGLQIQYFRQDRDTLEYLEWAEAMLDHFRTVGQDRPVRLTGRSVRDDEAGRYYQFLCDAAQNFVEAAPAVEPMEELHAAETMKGD